MPVGDATDGGDSLEDSYERLVNKYSQVTYLDDVKSILEWDEQTVLPEGGRPARSKQLGAISAILQERRSDSEFEVLLSSLETGGLTPDREANVREIRREYDRLAARPANFSERLSEATSEAKAAWEQARANDEFDRFEPHLERIVDLKREEAAALGTGENPYATLVSEYAPYTELETIDRIFDRLCERLVSLLADVRNAEIALHSQAFDGAFD